MMGSRHTRRLATIVLAGVFILGASGCYVGSSTVEPDNAYLLCPVGVDLGPGKISGGGDTTSYLSLWAPAPTAVSVQFAVTSSDTNQPITVDDGSTSFGVVWDGTHSTGTKTIRWSGTTAFLLHVQTRNLAHMDWWIMAVDATGKEVGFTCSTIYGWGGW